MSDDQTFLLRCLGDDDVPEYARMLHASFNAWYWEHGWGKDYFTCSPEETAIFHEMYNDLTPGCSVAAFHKGTSRIAGACFYHPRPHHVSLGIMSVHPEFGGQGVGRSLVDSILRYTRENGYPSCRLVGSAINMNSFSLYNRSGFVPRGVFHDMVVSADGDTHAGTHVPKEDCVRDAVIGDVAAMGELEMELSAIRRDLDYRYAIDNPRKVLHASVYENDQHGIDGFMISVRHPALSMIGPCVARCERTALALVAKELPRFQGTAALLLVPADKRQMVERLYAWGARNVETHLQQVWGEFQPSRGVNMPGFLPETG
ncbi:MAG TPA: GNAT family N-acetyltransferase [Thermoguttaceae bacterium]|nr:GNAT family N-acetyltransferase [Thermoguttaceae bacterium]